MSLHTYDQRSSYVSAEKFQMILFERKAERKCIAEQKRQHDLKRIQDMKSRVGVDPLEYWPKEIWEKVLDKLNPVEKGNMLKVHEVFQSLLWDKSISDILLPQMLPFEVTTGPVGQQTELRLVCKSMQNAVDEYYERNLLETLVMADTIYGYAPKPTPTTRIKLPKHIEEENMIQRHFSGPDNEMPKRFPYRSLELIISPYLFWSRKPSFPECEEYILQFLEHVGNEVWSFKFVCMSDIELPDYDEYGREVFKVSQLYKLLQQCLQLMPSLKWLELCFQEPGNWFSRTKRFKKVETLENYLPPTLTNLERLDIIITSRNQHLYEIYDAIVGANPHIKTLRLICSGKQFAKHLNRSKILSLQSVETFTFGQENNFDMKMEYVRTFINYQWPLKSICLQLTHYQCVTITKVFKLLENFPMLERVTLKIGKVKLEDKIFTLNLPNLVNFDMALREAENFEFTENILSFFSLQFLLYCDKLRDITWKNCVPLKDVKEYVKTGDFQSHIIDFASRLDKLSKSNIWKVFPSLEYITVLFKEDANVFFPNFFDRRKYRLGRLVG